jgi:hypothetical protein
MSRRNEEAAMTLLVMGLLLGLVGVVWMTVFVQKASGRSV